jgi:NAD(P)-dependent dehydrogenase (short-subunit alcohol dehydrogenase family)
MSKNPRQILITGASRGLGRAMAEEFTRHGHVVYGCCRRAEDAHKLNAQFGPPHRFAGVDVADAAAVDAWAKQLAAEAGRPIDLLLNNAAVISPNAALVDTDLDDFARLIDVNIKGVFHVVRAFVPGMIAAGRGVIVNFSSGWGRSVATEVAPYCASKWAIEGLTRALAEELPEGLAAVPLNPGIIDTDMLRSCFGGSAGSYPSASQWARTAVPFLLSLGPEHNGRPLTVPDAP